MSTTFNFGLGMATGLLLTAFAFNKPVLGGLAFQSAVFTAGAALEKLEASKTERLEREKLLEEALEFAEEKSEFWRRKYNEAEAFHSSLNQEDLKNV
ncbi:MAG: hypothetical protein ACRC8Y_17490 [Chroococcales cyanobacterium]